MPEMKSLLPLSLLIVFLISFDSNATGQDTSAYLDETEILDPESIKFQELSDFSKIEKRQCTKKYCCPIPLVCCFGGFCCYNYKKLMPMILCI
ncbi:unnamed protein product [Nezara viridula]|uniref:Neuropeptide n=1 Tax=Nezara viridula TaxID=85310 RepID=A0A9P0MTS0_NEZVI|nr:unnamed protein product [Nezara viridula]